MTEHVYVSLRGDHTILGFTHRQGRLEPKSSPVIRGGPGPLAVSPDRSTIYVGLRDEPALAALRIEPTGGLTELGRAPLEADPCHISTDRSGQYLLAAYFAAGMITVHAITDSGVPERSPRESRKTAKTAHMITADASNRFVLVPHRDSDVILQFTFDEETGKLSPADPDRAEMASGSGPRHFCRHPSGPWIYVSGELDSTVTACRFDPGSGSVRPWQTLSALPDGYSGESTCSQIHITPDGRWLYVSNRGHDSIAGFRVDSGTGRLERIGFTPTEPIPRAFNVDTAGRALFVAGRDSGKLVTYRIDGASGALSRVETYATGSGAMWVLAVAVQA